MFHLWKAKTSHHSCVLDFSEWGECLALELNLGNSWSRHTRWSHPPSGNPVQHGRHQVLDRRLHQLHLRHHHALQARRQIWSVDNLELLLSLKLCSTVSRNFWRKTLFFSNSSLTDFEGAEIWTLFVTICFAALFQCHEVFRASGWTAHNYIIVWHVLLGYGYGVEKN